MTRSREYSADRYLITSKNVDPIHAEQAQLARVLFVQGLFEFFLQFLSWVFLYAVTRKSSKAVADSIMADKCDIDDI